MNVTGGDIDECLGQRTVPVGIYAPPSVGPDEELFGLCIGDNHILVPRIGALLNGTWNSLELSGQWPAWHETGSSLTVNSTGTL